jgi:hypothetical protein
MSLGEAPPALIATSKACEWTVCARTRFENRDKTSDRDGKTMGRAKADGHYILPILKSLERGSAEVSPEDLPEPDAQPAHMGWQDPVTAILVVEGEAFASIRANRGRSVGALRCCRRQSVRQTLRSCAGCHRTGALSRGRCATSPFVAVAFGSKLIRSSGGPCDREPLRLSRHP